MKRILYLFSLSVLLIAGCVRKEITFRGDEAELVTINKNNIEIEIIAVTDTCVIFSMLDKDMKLYYINKSDITSLAVQGYAGDDWHSAVLLGQCLPVVLLGIAAASYSDGDANILVPVACAVPAGLSFLLFGATEGEVPEWRSLADIKSTTLPGDSLDINESNLPGLEILKKYARYPDGLNETRLNWLLKARNQKEMIRYQ